MALMIDTMPPAAIQVLKHAPYNPFHALGVYKLADARSLDFTLPREGATHIHFDAAAMRNPRALARLVVLYEAHHLALRTFAGTNPACVRLGEWPPELGRMTRTAQFQAMAWPEAAKALSTIGLKKWCDINLANLVNAAPDKDTIEFRFFPATFDSEAILRWARGCEAILRFCLDPAEPPVPDTAEGLCAAIPALRGS